MQKVLLLLLLCLFALALGTWRSHSTQSPSTVATEELRPELVPFYLVTFGIRETIIQSKRRCSNTSGLHTIQL